MIKSLGFLNELSLPVIVAPMFLVSGPELVTACCRSGVVGSFPFPNARKLTTLDKWLFNINKNLSDSNVPYAVNLTTHKTYDRLDEELILLKKYKPKIVITALGSPIPVIDIVHNYGGFVIADVNSIELAKKAISAGVDGLALVSFGAGGHTGHMNGYSFVSEVRSFYDGFVILAGGISSGASIRAAQIAGANCCYMGTSFIASEESIATTEYKKMITQATFDDLILSDKLTGANALYLRQSLLKMGFDLNNIGSGSGMDLSGSDKKIKAWRDIWSAGHGVGSVKSIESVSTIIDNLKLEYEVACK